MARVELQPGFADHNKRVVGRQDVPWFNNEQKAVITFAAFPDHGKPVYLGSLLKTHPLFLGLARGLNGDESRKVNSRIRIVIERYLDQGENRCAATMSSLREGKPDIQVEIIGDSFDANSLRLYYHRGDFMGAPAFYIDAVAKTKYAKKVENALGELAGYQMPNAWIEGKKKRKN
ncbi:MAG: hypothetical protein A2171_00670 [Candidatus Levybacteria bacterium RBG_13_35_9]|nr:MAG: hypothetical protein A2171_00670 [Candidatus Levybacteria bacterium RBG_13_35_9]